MSKIPVEIILGITGAIALIGFVISLFSLIISLKAYTKIDEERRYIINYFTHNDKNNLRKD